jgi:hypothetical protein
MGNLEMPDGGQEAPQRPTEEDLKEKLDMLEQQKKMSSGMYLSVKNELQYFLEGEGEQDVREQYYKGWTNEDFKELLNRMEQK